MVIFKIIIFSFLFGLFGCSTSFDDDTIAIIGNQKISKSSFHKYLPQVRFNLLSDSLKIEKVKDFLIDIIKIKDIKQLKIEQDNEIKKEMGLWSRRTLAGLLFDKKILNSVFPEDSLKKIYNDYKIDKNISVIVIPYVKKKRKNIPNKEQAEIIANDIYNRSQIEKFEHLQKLYSKVEGNPNEGRSHWTRLFSGVKAVDRVLWNYKVGETTKPIDDGQSFRIIKVNDEKVNTKLPEYIYQKDILIKKVVELWKKPLQDHFVKYTDSLLQDASFYVDQKSLNNFSKNLEELIKGKDIISALKNSNYEKTFGRYKKIDLNRRWFLNQLTKEENLFGYQLADPKLAYGFVRGFITSKVNYEAAIKMGFHKSPAYLEKYDEEIKTRTNNFYDINVYMKGLKATDQEMLNFYENNKKDFNVPPKILSQSLWFNDYKIAEEYHSRILNNPDSFNRIYKNFLRNKNSNYGASEKFIIPSSSSDPFHKLFKLQNGAITEPFDRGNKFYIIKIIEKIKSQSRSFDEVKSQIFMRLTKMNESKNKKIARDRLLKKFKVSINEDLVQS